MPSVRVANGRVLAIAAAVATGLGLVFPASGAAQYFGRNKVQYQNFHFRRLKTPHFDIYYYPAESLAASDAGRMAERWYVRHAATLDAAFERRSIILYSDPPDFEQTNVISGFISQGTGGVTEGLRSRVVLPFTGVYSDDDHVIGHELTHVFQYDIAGSMRGGGMVALSRLPLWLIEGMAEYLSIGRADPNTAMWLRDAAQRNDLPTIKKLSTDPRYFPYRYGEALWAYIGGRWGDDIIQQLYRASLQGGFENGIRRTLGMTSDTLSAQWLAAIKSEYLPLMEGRAKPDDVGTRLLRPSGKYGDMDVAPALSPDGKYVAFYTSRGLFNIDLYVADATTGKIVKKLTGPNTDQHFDAISFINSSGTWSPDGKEFAFIVFADGDNEIDIFDVARDKIVKRIHPKRPGAINDVSWGAGNKLVFSGIWGGLSDLYEYDLSTDHLEQLTNDRYADLQPTWSPDGRTIAFVTDSGPLTSFDTLKYGPMHLALMDAETHAVRLVPVFDSAKSINPQWSPDGTSIYFVSDRGGFDDIYRIELATGQISKVTNVSTGISGITALSPTLSVARDSGRLVFSVFERGGYSLHRLEADQAVGTPVTPGTADTTNVAADLPPMNVASLGAVTQRVRDPLTGLQPPEQYPTLPYNPSFSLDYLGSPGVGIGVGPYGTVAGGGVAAYFSDQLGNDVIGAALGGAGDIQDFGGQAFYANLAHRWNYQVGISHTPYPLVGADVLDTTVDIGNGPQPAYIFEQFLQRQFYDQITGQAQYPFSMTQRFEIGLGFTHLSYSTTLYRYLTLTDGTYLGYTQQDISSGLPTLNFGSVSAAFVGDYSYFGFTSPVAGGRYRFEVDPTFGNLQMETVLADYRRYFLANPITIAFRAIHLARYGKDSEDPLLSPLYVGDPALVRGYDYNSFNSSECRPSSTDSCPVFDRLLGSKMAVANLEIRIPLFGTDQYGLFNFPYLPTEIAPFVDAGVAWNSYDKPSLSFSPNSLGRVPVWSAGVTARFNVLGYLVAEVFYAHPFQRPDAKNQWGFQILPGW